MHLRCTSWRVLITELFDLSKEIAPCNPLEVDYEAESYFLCERSGEGHEIHSAFLRPIPDAKEVVFFYWKEGIFGDSVCVIPHCGKREQCMQGEICYLPRWHTGACSWAVVDPEETAQLARGDQERALVSDFKRHLKGLRDPSGLGIDP